MTTQTIRWDGEFIVWISPPLHNDALEYLTGQGAPRYPLPAVVTGMEDLPTYLWVHGYMATDAWLYLINIR